MSSKNRDRILFRTFAAGMLKHLEDERILLLDLPHFVEQICCGRTRAILTATTNAACDMRGDAIRERLFNVLREILERAQLVNVKRRFPFIVRMRGHIQPWVFYVITQSQDECFTSLAHYLRIKRIGA